MMGKSCITSDIEVSCHSKEQLAEALAWLVEYNYNFEYDVDQCAIPVRYSLRVQQMSWASNLKDFAEVLMKSDLDV